MRARAACLVACLLASPARADRLDDLRARIGAVLEREGVPGAGIALVEGDRITWAGGVGVADRASGRPVTADTLFRVGSITKSFVALTIVRLAEEGRIDLNARVADLAPELAIVNPWQAEQPITVAHLLEHTAGFDDMHPNETFGPPGIDGMPLADVLARNPASRVARWRPGSRFSYANPGYTVAAYLIEKVTGERYEDVVAREVLRPLGMSHAVLRLTPEARAQLATGYQDRETPLPYVEFYHRPAGNLMASPRELAEIVRLGLARGRGIVSPEGFARIERGETARFDLGPAGYGLGNYGEVSERAPIRGHSGGLPGFLSVYGYLPDCGVGYVVLINSTGSAGALPQLRRLVVEYLLEGATVPPPPPRAPVADAELDRWVGVYHLASPRSQLFAFLVRLGPSIEIRRRGDRLVAGPIPAGPPPIELLPLGRDRFRAPTASGAHVVFGEADGRRVVVVPGGYFAEEPGWLTYAWYYGARAAILVLASGVLLPLGGLVRRARTPAPGLGWPLAASLSFFAMSNVLEVAFRERVAGELNVWTVALWLLTMVFAAASLGSAAQALAWLGRPAAREAKAYRLVFAVAACAATAFLASHGLIGLRLWSY